MTIMVHTGKRGPFEGPSEHLVGGQKQAPGSCSIRSDENSAQRQESRENEEGRGAPQSTKVLKLVVSTNGMLLNDVPGNQMI